MQEAEKGGTVKRRYKISKGEGRRGKGEGGSG